MTPSPSQIENVVAELAELRGQVAELKAVRARRFRWLVAAVLLGAATAFASVITDGLYVFAPNTPALSTEANYNFNQLRTWMRNKVGMDLNSADIVAPGNISATGAMSAASWSGPFSTVSSARVGNAGTTFDVLGTVAMFGAPVVIGVGTTYVATTDGLVFVTLASNSNCNQGPAYAQGVAGPAGSLTVRGQTSVHGGCSGQDYATAYGSFMMPVRKGEQYNVGLAGNGGTYPITVTFLPLGR